MDGFESLEKYLCFSFLAISPLIMVRFEKFKNWHAAENVLCRDIVPIGGTSGHLGRNRDCPAEIGTLDMSVLRTNKPANSRKFEKALSFLEILGSLIEF